jgi:hypothetical protein
MELKSGLVSALKTSTYPLSGAVEGRGVYFAPYVRKTKQIQYLQKFLRAPQGPRSDARENVQVSLYQ